MNLLAYQAKCAEIANAAIAGEKPQITAPEEKKETKVADIKDWEGVKVMPQPKPQMDLEGMTWVLVDEIEDGREEIAAIYHSHTKSEAYPSQTDVNLAANWPDPLYIICSLADPERPDVRAFAIRDGDVEEVALDVD